MLDEGARLEIYDPKVAKEQIELDLGVACSINEESRMTFGSWNMSDSPYSAAINADAVVILTEWDEFYNIDWVKIREVMRKPSGFLILEILQIIQRLNYLG